MPPRHPSSSSPRVGFPSGRRRRRGATAPSAVPGPLGAIVVLVVLVVLVATTTGCRPSDAPATPAAPGDATVVAVIDGDTIDVTIGGRRERVRLLGIDTPETVDESRPVGCYGPEASARATALLPAGTRVRLERDLEARDRFGRLLAYVHRRDDDVFVNLSLLEEGYAELLVIEPNHAEVAAFRAARDRARAAGRGLWGACARFGEPLDPSRAPTTR